ncbi:hypothetical protein ACUW90_002507 [Staphylococcus simulans]
MLFLRRLSNNKIEPRAANNPPNNGALFALSVSPVSGKAAFFSLETTSEVFSCFSTSGCSALGVGVTDGAVGSSGVGSATGL